jgi:hypothetical protein
MDFNGTLIANIMQYLFMNETVELNEDLIRHMVLNSIKSVKQKFSEYGQLIISCDSRDYWRKDLFPYYKIKRKKDRDKSSVNWSDLYIYMDKIKKEISDNFKYPVIEVDKAESDDIIGFLVNKSYKEPILIISRDKDFISLQKYPNVKQYSTVDKKYYETNDPNKYLFENIIKGCTSDSIPNIFSSLDSIALGKRQKPVFQNKIDLWWKEKNIPEEYQERFNFNRKLIDLSMTPKDIQENILESYQNQINKKKKNLINYFIQHNLKEQLSNIQDF